MEKTLLEKCKPCYCYKSFGSFIETHFYACDLEDKDGFIGVYRKGKKGYHKITFNKSIFEQHFAVCDGGVSPDISEIVRKIHDRFKVDICAKLNISENEMEYHYKLEISMTNMIRGYYTFGIFENVVVTAKSTMNMEFNTEENALKFGIKESKKVIITNCLSILSIEGRLRVLFGLKKYGHGF